ncbi:NUDIX domain-containing protein [Brevibacillus ruminantium]|uniref:NUDIX domain-containing protein n=1 Tax=Brevibacillus ruminantium TaxID=2950604 RepID=A0ABY4WEE3_9BACL|nr:NUDIX domain-containing protein [Brevibacillus ruminantium]USG64322.1 NUDIX domain-containing protein [Brevibacillus ruminantium]
MKNELLDIFDEEGVWIGTESRSEVHRLGLWHRTFHCWIYRREQDAIYLLFQKRHAQKDTWPEKLDITSAGHLLAGEQPEEGVRELEEELGMTVPIERLQSIGVIPDVLHEPGIHDKEWCHVYACESAQPLSAYKLQQDEVIGLLWIGLNDVKRLAAGEVAEVEANGFVRDADGRETAGCQRVAWDDLVPHEPHYYEAVFRAIEGFAASPR